MNCKSPSFYLFMIRMTFTGNFEGLKINKIKQIDDPRVPRKQNSEVPKGINQILDKF